MKLMLVSTSRKINEENLLNYHFEENIFRRKYKTKINSDSECEQKEIEMAFMRRFKMNL